MGSARPSFAPQPLTSCMNLASHLSSLSLSISICNTGQAGERGTGMAPLPEFPGDDEQTSVEGSGRLGHTGQQLAAPLPPPRAAQRGLYSPLRAFVLGWQGCTALSPLCRLPSLAQAHTKADVSLPEPVWPQETLSTENERAPQGFWGGAAVCGQAKTGWGGPRRPNEDSEGMGRV